ncbi:MAG: hypothetical protein KGI27_09945 [Thaumarchaeota archaeon]|nr:hypothetical protein [Nitrososphaerota archaeon]
MSTIKSLYGTNNQAITITLASLTNAAFRQSTAVDNTTNLFLDALVSVVIKTAAASTSSTGYVAVYAYGTTDGGTHYTDGASGTDGAFTPTTPPNIRLIGLINAVANSTTYVGGPFSVAAAFGGVLPDHWGIIVENETGATLDATAANFVADYQGWQNQVV